MNLPLQRVKAEKSWAGDAYSLGNLLYCTYIVVAQNELVRLLHIELLGCHSILDLYGTLDVRIIEHCSTLLSLVRLVLNPILFIHTRLDRQFACSLSCNNVYVIVETVQFLLLDQLADKFLIFIVDVVTWIHPLADLFGKKVYLWNFNNNKHSKPFSA